MGSQLHGWWQTWVVVKNCGHFVIAFLMSWVVAFLGSVSFTWELVWNTDLQGPVLIFWEWEWGWESEDGNGPGSVLSGSGGVAPAPVTLTDSARVLVNPVCNKLAGLGYRGRIPWTYKIWGVHACWENALHSEKKILHPPRKLCCLPKTIKREKILYKQSTVRAVVLTLNLPESFK